PRARAASGISRNVVSAIVALAGLTSTAIRTALGTKSCKSPNRLATNSDVKKLMPVALPPGRARLATRPILTGSSPTPKTIGIVVVTALAASEAATLLDVAITAKRRRTRSAMSDDRRSNWPLSQWHVLAFDVAGFVEAKERAEASVDPPSTNP